MAVSFRKKSQKVTVVCLASLISIVVVVIIAIIMFASNPIGIIRGCYVFLKTKIAEK